MNRKLPPHLYERRYRTRGGYLARRYYVKITDSKGIRRTIPAGPDFEAAKALCQKILGENAQRLDFDKPVRESFEAWAHRWLRLKAHKRSADKDRLSASRLIAFFKDAALSDLSHIWIQEYKIERRKQAAPATVNRELSLLRSILYLAFHDGKLIRLPKIEFFPELNQRARTATTNEIQALTANLPPHLLPVYFLLWSSGMRVSEVIGLTGEQVDLGRFLIHLPGQVTKSGQARLIPISTKAAELLRPTYRPHGRLWPGLTQSMISWYFRQACQRAEIRGLWLHDLRGTFVSERLRERWDRKLIMEITGHRSHYAFDRYARPRLEDLREVVEPPSNRQRIVNMKNEVSKKRR